jgi:hypothetical protein
MPAPSFLTPVTDSSIFLFLVLHTRGGAWGMELPQAFLFVPNPEPRTRLEAAAAARPGHLSWWTRTQIFLFVSWLFLVYI